MIFSLIQNLHQNRARTANFTIAAPADIIPARLTPAVSARQNSDSNWIKSSFLIILAGSRNRLFFPKRRLWKILDADSIELEALAGLLATRNCAEKYQ